MQETGERRVRSCNTCIPLLAADAAVTRANGRIQRLAEKYESQDAELTANRDWVSRLSALRKRKVLRDAYEKALEIATQEQVVALGKLASRDACPGRISDVSGQNFTCGYGTQLASADTMPPPTHSESL